MFEKFNAKMTQFYEEIDDPTVTSLAPVNRLTFSRFDNIASLMLERIKGCQKDLGKLEAYSLIEHWNTSRKNLLLSGIAVRHVEQTVSHFRNEMERKSQALADVMPGHDEDSMKNELQEKLAITNGDINTKKKKKKSKLREKRHQTITSRTNLRSMLSKQLLTFFQKFDDDCSLSEERCVFEELTMTLLQLMTSSGTLSSRECRLILEESRSQKEEIKRKFSLERKRKEEVLKRKTEQMFSERESETRNFGLPKSEDAKIIYAIMNASDDVTMTSLKKLSSERSTIQERFQIKRESNLEVEKALIEQELFTVKKLSSSIGVEEQEMRKTIQLLLPIKSNEYATKLSQVLCSDRRKKTPNSNNGKLFDKIQQLVIRKHQATRDGISTRSSKRFGSLSPSSTQRSKLHSLSSIGYPGVRPEPVGRTATPENMDRMQF